MKASASTPKSPPETGSAPYTDVDTGHGRLVTIRGAIEDPTSAEFTRVVVAAVTRERMLFRICRRSPFRSWWWRPWRRWREEIVRAVPRVSAGGDVVQLYEVETVRVTWSALEPGGRSVFSSSEELVP